MRSFAGATLCSEQQGPSLCIRCRPISSTLHAAFNSRCCQLTWCVVLVCRSACVRDASDPAKVDHLKKLSALGDPALTTSRNSEPGVVKVFEADLTAPGSYDKAMAGCTCVVHVGTPMGYAGNNNPREIFDGAVEGTMNIIDTIKRVGSVKRLICACYIWTTGSRGLVYASVGCGSDTSSFAAVGHPAPPGYVYTEKDWASDGRKNDPLWNFGDGGELTRPKEEDWEAISKVGDLSCELSIVLAYGAHETHSGVKLLFVYRVLREQTPWPKLSRIRCVQNLQQKMAHLTRLP